MGEWIKAEDVPKAFEGMRAWIYEPWAKTIEIGWVPTNYSRDPAHCAGIQVWPLFVPPPPGTGQPCAIIDGTL